MLLDAGDPLISENFPTALDFARLNSRCAFGLSQRAPALLRELESGPVWLTVRYLALLFDCSKPTVRCLMRRKLLRARRRSGDPLSKALITRSSAVLFLELCARCGTAWRPRGIWAFVHISRRLRDRGPRSEYARLPSELTVREAARFMRCSPSSVRRMIRYRTLRAHRPTPGRWAIKKKNLHLSARRRNPREIP